MQTSNRAEAVYSKIRDVINGGVEAAEEKLGMVPCHPLSSSIVTVSSDSRDTQIMDLLTGHVESAKHRGQAAYQQGRDYADEKVNTGQDYLSGKYTERKYYASQIAKEGKDYASQKAAEGKDYAYQKATEGKDHVASKTQGAKDTAGAKTAEFEKAGKKYWNEKVEGAKRQADKAKVEL